MVMIVSNDTHNPQEGSRREIKNWNQLFAKNIMKFDSMHFELRWI